MASRRRLLHFPGQAWAPALLGWLGGTALQLQQAALWQPGAYLAGLAGLIGLLGLVGLVYGFGLIRPSADPGLLRVPWVHRLGYALLAASLAFACTGLRAVVYQQSALSPALEGRDVDVIGRIATMPQNRLAGQRFRLEVEQATLDGRSVALPDLLDVGWYTRAGSYGGAELGTDNGGVSSAGSVAFLQAGERWSMRLRLKAPHGAANPFGFDYELWLWEQGVQASAYVRTGPRDPTPRRLGQTGLHPVEWLRQRVLARLKAHVPEGRSLGVLSALLVGDQNAVDRADWDVFRATGVAHLLSISGLHITLLAWAVGGLLGAGWRRVPRLAMALPAPQASLLAAVLAALAYSLFAGWGVPAQRTCLMLATVALLRWGGLQWPRALVWLLALAVVVALDPWALLQAGFWLSFVAVGLLFVRGAEPQAASLWARMRLLLQEQGYLSLALAPMSALLFGQVSLVGLLANLWAIPWVTLVVTPLAMLGALLPWAWSLADLAVGAMLWLLDPMAQWPFAVWTLPRPGWTAGLLALAGGLWLALPQAWPMRLLGLPLLLPVVLAQASAPPEGEFRLLAPDIGQGNAVLVRTHRHTLLVDAGPRYSLESDAGHRVLVPLLQALQWPPDTVVLTHPDTDHVGGAAAVLAMQPTARLVASAGRYGPELQGRVSETCVAGTQWTWDGVDFAFLFPTDADYLVPGSPNARSCVLRISNGRQTALLLGDLEQAQEALLLQRGINLKADLLLVPHHGSRTSSSAALLDAVQPQWALVQSGYRNRFGHPAPDVMQRYQERHILVRDSPHCGAMTWDSAQPDALRCHRADDAPYWRHAVP